MTYLDYLQIPENVAKLEDFYAFGVVSNAQYIHAQVLLEYIKLRDEHPKMSDDDCAFLLSRNPHYALTDGSIKNIIKKAKRKRKTQYSIVLKGKLNS